MIPVADALARILQMVQTVGAETLPLEDVAARVLAKDLIATSDLPPFRSSAMDGYAVQRSQLTSKSRFRIIGESRAGTGFATPVGQAETVRIFTGAPLPEGTDMVIPQEDAQIRNDHVLFEPCEDRNSHVRPAGGDFKAGARLRAPVVMTPERLSLAAAMNQAQLMVYCKPRVCIIPTGDELVAPGSDLQGCQVVASSGYGIAAMLQNAGAAVTLLPIAGDSAPSLRNAFQNAAHSDLIVTIGGASVGDYDLVARIAQDLGAQMFFQHVAMRPGKPLMAGRLGCATMVGVPGNPVSALVCTAVFLVPAVHAMLGLPARARASHPMVLAAPVSANGPRQHYMRARFVYVDGRKRVEAADRQDSHLLRELAEAHALILRPPNDPVRQAGEEVRVIDLAAGLEMDWEGC